MAALIAILAYNAMQIGVFGPFGAATAGFFAGYGLDLPWWVWTHIGIALVAVFGFAASIFPHACSPCSWCWNISSCWSSTPPSS